MAETTAGIVGNFTALQRIATLTADNARLQSALVAMQADRDAAAEDEETFWRELIEKDDRTSPEEYPEMALVTREELVDFCARAARRALAKQEPTA